jgi:pyrrolidone-carboxylate peptidase
MLVQEPLRLLLCGFLTPEQAGHAAHHLLEYAAAAQKEGRLLEEMAVEVVRLPFSHERAPQAALEALQAATPDYFLLLATDPASADYKLHALAANYADDEREDEDQATLQDTILDPEGPVAYRSRLPLDGIWDKFLVERVPVRMSHKAGLFVFNHVLYDVMRAVDLEGRNVRCGAIETPPMKGEEIDDAEGRSREQLEEELHMILAVLEHLHPAMEPARAEEGA